MTERMNKKCTNEKILPGIFLFEMTFEQINLHDDPSYQNAEKMLQIMISKSKNYSLSFSGSFFSSNSGGQICQ